MSVLLSRYAMCSLGRDLAARIRPATRPELIRRWLTQFDELNRLVDQRGWPPFGGVHDIREPVARCAPPLRVSVEEMATIRDTLAATHDLAAYFTELPSAFAELGHIAERIGDFRTLADRIGRVIDERGAVRDDASPKISRIRAELEATKGGVAEAVERLLKDPAIRRLLQFPNATFHNDRLVLPLKMEYRGRLAGIIHRTSDTGATIYVEPSVAVELNNRISDLRISEQEEIHRLLWELAHEVHLNADAIRSTIDALALLDLIAAKVRYAQDYELRSPALWDDAKVEAREARHPLLMQLFRERAEGGADEEAVTPINYRLGVDFRMMIVTGPNTGGKTVALKTIGLLSMMVQAGLPVPVGPGSTFGIFQNVLIDIGDEQSIQQNLSTFSGHLKRMLEIVQRAGGRTLVLIDELGAGTDPDEGAAIGAAILDELIAKNAIVVATTHLGALKSFPLMRNGVENASVEFDVETLRPLYHLRIGEPGRSNAIHIAQRLGMPQKLVDAAEQNLSRRAKIVRAALDSTSAVKRAAERARNEAQTAQLAAAKAVAAAEKEKVRLQQAQQEYQAWVQRVVHLQPGDAVRVRGFDREGRLVRLRLDQHRAEISLGIFSIEVPLGDVLPPAAPAPPPRAEKPAADARKPRPEFGALEKPVRGSSAPSEARMTAPRESRPRRPALQREPQFSDAQILALTPGDEVFVKRLRRTGYVVRLVPAKRVIVVNVGLLEVEAPFNGIGPISTNGDDTAR